MCCFSSSTDLQQRRGSIPGGGLVSHPDKMIAMKPSAKCRIAPHEDTVLPPQIMADLFVGSIGCSPPPLPPPQPSPSDKPAPRPGTRSARARGRLLGAGGGGLGGVRDWSWLGPRLRRPRLFRASSRARRAWSESSPPAASVLRFFQRSTKRRSSSALQPSFSKRSSSMRFFFSWSSSRSRMRSVCSRAYSRLAASSWSGWSIGGGGRRCRRCRWPGGLRWGRRTAWLRWGGCPAGRSRAGRVEGCLGPAAARPHRCRVGLVAGRWVGRSAAGLFAGLGLIAAGFFAGAGLLLGATSRFLFAGLAGGLVGLLLVACLGVFAGPRSLRAGALVGLGFLAGGAGAF